MATDEGAAFITNLKKEIDEVDFPDNFDEAVKIMNDKYSSMLKVIEMKSQIKLSNDIAIIKGIVVAFGIVHAIGIIIAFIATYNSY